MKVGDFDIIEAMAISATKTLGEKFLTPYVGNGNLKSGAVKLALAYFVGKAVGGKVGKYIANGLAIDGTEDLFISFTSGGFGLQPANSMEDVI